MLSLQESEKVWLLTGVTGMDGSTACDMLLEKGYKNIHGMMRFSSTFNTENINHIFDKITLHYADLTDSLNIHTVISKVRPDYIINFAAQSHVKVSHELEDYTLRVNTLGVLNILQSVRSAGLDKSCKIYQCGTSEEYGNQTDGSSFLTETSPKIPVSVYGVSKLAAENLCNIYRDAFEMFVVCGTLFNHESERRGKTFITQKITEYVAKYNAYNTRLDLNLDTIQPLQLGNIYSCRDWSYSNDCVEAIYLMLMQPVPKNYIISSGTSHSVKEFVELSFREIGIDIVWNGTGLDEKGCDSITGETVVEINAKYFRPIDIEHLLGDSSLARKELHWKPKTSFPQLVKKMVKNSISRFNELLLKKTY